MFADADVLARFVVMSVGTLQDFDNDISSAKSTDGITWTLSNNSPFTTDSYNYVYAPARGLCIGWNGSYWVMGGTSYDLTLNFGISYNGMDWTPQTSVPYIPNNYFGTSVEWVDDHWISVVTDINNNGSMVLRSIDGLTWTTVIAYTLGNVYTNIAIQYVPPYLNPVAPNTEYKLVFPLTTKLIPLGGEGERVSASLSLDHL